MAASNTVDATFAATTGIQCLGSGCPEIHAPRRQSDRKIIAAGVMAAMNGRSTRGVESDTPIDLGAYDPRPFYISPSSNDLRQIFWRRHLSPPS